MHESAPKGNEVHRIRQALAHAVEAVTGDPNADPLVVFPNPASKERREDVVFSEDLTSEQETDFRAAMAELGPGREEDKGLDTSRLSNAGSAQRNPNHDLSPYEWKALLEGGQYHKMKAELDLVMGQDILPTMIVASGARDRVLGDKEKELTVRHMGIKPEEVAGTEFEVIRQTFEINENFVPYPKEKVANVQYSVPSRGSYQYHISREGVQGSDVDGQFTIIGELAGVPVMLMRIDRFPDPEHPDDPSKYLQLDNDQKVSLVSRLIPPAAEEFDSNTGFVTSATYEPSCEVAARQAIELARTSNVTAQVLSYGTVRLAGVKGEDPSPPELKQLAGEAHKTAKVLKKYEAAREKREAAISNNSDEEGYLEEHDPDENVTDGLDENGRGWSQGIYYKDWNDPGTQPE